MFRKFITIFALLLCAASAHAGEAGRVVFVVGQANIGGKAVALNDSVQEGSEIATGPDGYVYLKTIDDGFLILRPSSRARIAAYHIDASNPANTRVKLELLNGVARTISGQGVKQARQNFRFNTPVAAIGVRGTDFTVYTDSETSRVAVISGGVVVSGFSNTCGPEGHGPCEGNASRELFANQVGQLLQVRKGQAAPQVLPSQGASPDLNAPPRSDEPGTKSANTSTPRVTNDVISLDVQKTAELITPRNNQAPIPTPPGNTPTTPVVDPAQPVEPQQQIVWGRWKVLVNLPANMDLTKLLDAKGELIDGNAYFAVVRTKGAEWQTPTQGSLGFALKQSEAFIFDDMSVNQAKLENGQLKIDFAKASFATSFDLVSQQNERFKLQALGAVSRDGTLYGNSQFESPTNMIVKGVVGPENGGTAAYVFSSNLGGNRTALGATYWTKN